LLLSKVQPYLKNLTDRNGVLNAWITYVPASDRWSFQIWGKNLTNRVTAASGANYFFNGLSPAEVASGLNEFDRGIYNPPRQVGMTARYKFD
jgi:outer membrane receptor protein involved in Fe transport